MRREIFSTSNTLAMISPAARTASRGCPLAGRVLRPPPQIPRIAAGTILTTHCLSQRNKIADVHTEVAPVQPRTRPAAPRWVEPLFLGVAIYAGVCAACMLSGIGGASVTHLIGLISDWPANLAAAVTAAAAARRSPSRLLRRAWTGFAAALGIYLVGTTISLVDSFLGIEPFPSFADIFYLAFFPAM